MTATIKDVAKKTGLSTATVSRALNNKYGVKQETRDKVLAVAQDAGYTPNAVARGLVKSQTQSIGLIIPDISNPFYPEIVKGVEAGADENGYNIFLCNTNYKKDKQYQYVRLLAQKRVDGIILAPGSEESTIHNDRPVGAIPVVYLCKRLTAPDKSLVVIDDERGGFLATKHLIEQGYQSIGFIGAHEDGFLNGQRFKGYQQAFEKYSMPIDERFIFSGDFKRETGYRVIRRIIKSGDCPRALFVENDLMALGVIQGIKEMGLGVPGDVAVVGFDDIPFAAFPEIGLTTVNQPKYKMGKIAVDMLLKKINNNTAEPKKIILEPELVVRTSSC